MASLLRFVAGILGKNDPPKRYACAYQFPARLVLHSEIQTPFGRFASEPFCGLGLDAMPEVLGAAVLEVLHASRRADDAPQGMNFGKWYLEQMGVKSNAQLQRGALSVGIALAQGVIEFSPTHNGGTSGDTKGFQPVGKTPVAVPAGAPANEVARALRQAFDLCTSVYA